MMKTKYSLPVLFILLSFRLSATHIIGGYFSFSRVGEPQNGLVNYSIRLTVIRDCKSNVSFDDSISIGIYRASDKLIYQSLRCGIRKVIKTASCYGTCIDEGYYEELISVPVSAAGYYLTWERCCRPPSESVARSQSGDDYQGTLFYAFTGSTAGQNTSPSGIPVSPMYICLNDTATFTFSAKDADGDSVVIEPNPLNGGPTLGNPLPEPTAQFEGFKQIQYNSGFSDVYPLGISNTYSFNQPARELTLFCKSKEGAYPVAFSVKEYRLGNLISQTIIETQIIVTAGVCGSETLRPYNITGWASEPYPTANLKWQMCRPDIEEQYIERSTANTSSFQPVDTVGQNTRDYSDFNLSYGETYYYRIKARSNGGDIMVSDTAEVQFWNAGLEQNSFETKFSVYPVPFDSKITLSAQGSAIQSYCISDYTGRIILQKTNAESLETQEIDLSGLPAGMFVIEALMADGSRINRKIIKNN